jgi:hypothetical protein
MVPVVKVYLVGVVVCKTFVAVSQFLNRKVQDPRLLVAQLQTVIQTRPTGAPFVVLAVMLRLKVQVPDWIVAPPRSVL